MESSQCDAEMTYGTAKQLLSVIGDYDDDVIYGYAGWGKDAARFRDFKELLQDAADTKNELVLALNKKAVLRQSSFSQ